MNAVNAATVFLTPNLLFDPDKTAYICGSDLLSYRDLDRRSRAFASLLRRRGVLPGDRVLILLPDNLAFPVAFLGCLLCGAVAVAAGAELSEDEIAFVMDDSTPSFVVTEREATFADTGSAFVIQCFGGQIEGLESRSTDPATTYQPSDEDIAYILYTSGSTGCPKAVPHRHKTLLAPCDFVGKQILGVTRDDIIFSSSKLSFAYGLINSLAFPLRFGATAILHPGISNPVTLLHIMERHKPTLFFSVPDVYARMILSCTDRSLSVPMRLCCSAGERLPVPVYDAWHELTGKEILDGIGSTEAGYHFICNIPGAAVAGSAGRLVSGYRARLVDDKGNDVPSGCEGNLLISGETCSPVYWNKGKLLETAGRNGFLSTGDIFVEAGGFYYHRGRSDDMIKCGGRWVPPQKVEEALRLHPAVADCAVAAVSVGTFVKPGAFVVARDGMETTPDLDRQLMEHVRNLLPEYMRPVKFRFMSQLPRTSTGKVQRYRLREL